MQLTRNRSTLLIAIKWLQATKNTHSNKTEKYRIITLARNDEHEKHTEYAMRTYVVHCIHIEKRKIVGKMILD